MTDAKTYWDAQFEENIESKTFNPNKFLKSMLPRLAKGRVLDVAMGTGSNAVYLAKQGFDVRGFDVSDVAISIAEELAKYNQVSVETNCVDLDFFLMDLMEYDSIVMTQFKPSLTRFYGEMVRGLKQGGTLIIDSYGMEEMGPAIPKDEAYKDFYFKSNELIGHLKDLKILFYQEGEIDGVHVVQCLAQKPLDRDAIKYNLFDMHTSDGTEKKSKQLELAEQLFKK